MPAGSADVVMVSGAFTVRVNSRSAVIPSPLVTRTVNVEPDPVGVPESTP